MTFTPSSRAFIAGLVWLTAGLLLIWRGLFPFWMSIAQESLSFALILLGVASVLGAAKGWFVLRRTANRVLAHIDAHPGPQGLGAIYPPRSYLLIPLMVIVGIGIRAWLGETQPAVVAGIYLGVGAALLGSTAPYFLYWKRQSHLEKSQST